MSHAHGTIPTVPARTPDAPVERTVPSDIEQAEPIDLDKARALIDAERIQRQQAAAAEIHAVCEKYGVRLEVQSNIALLDAK